MKSLNESLENLFNTSLDNIILSRCNNGDVNSSYIASYGDDKYFIKIQDKENLPNLYENQIEREVISTALCTTQGIPCPQILDYDFAAKFIITEYMDYDVLGNLWGLFDLKKQIQIKDQALCILEKMNNIKSECFGGLYKGGKLEQFTKWTDSYKNIVKIALNDCLRYGSLSENECKVITDKVTENCKQLDQEKQTEAVFSHLDLHWNNIFMDKDTQQIKGIFDFGSALYTPSYMSYFRLNGGFLYGTDSFYTKETICPMELKGCEYECAKILNTLDYFTFLSYKNMNYEMEKRILLE
jgi:fructosamine-3-kinase